MAVEGGEPFAWYRDREGTYPCAAQKEGGLVFGFDLLRMTGEVMWSGYFESPSALPSTRSVQYVPTVDKLALLLARQLTGMGSGTPRSPWPGGAPFALCLTHDVDRLHKTFQYVTHPLRNLARGDVRQFLQRLRTTWAGNTYWQMPDVMSLEGELGVRSSFYTLDPPKPPLWRPGRRFLAWGGCRLDDPLLPPMLRALDAGGWEVGLHPSLESLRSRERLAKEKANLEAVIGHPIQGVRQHYLRMPFPQRWHDFESLGVSYDASAGFSRQVGFRHGTSFPFRPFDGSRALNYTELPLAIMDGALPDDEEEAWRVCLRMLEEVRRVGGLATVLWHQRFFNEADFPGFRSVYRRIVEYARAHGAWIAPARDIISWWNA